MLQLVTMEYKLLRLDIEGVFGGKFKTDEIELQLNKWGAEGWKLVKTSEVLSGGTTVSVVAFLERAAG